MDKRIFVFNVKTPTKEVSGESVQAISHRIKSDIAEKGDSARISGGLSKDVRFSQSNAFLYVRNGNRNVFKRFWEAITFKDVTQRKGATLAVEHLLKRFEDQPDAQHILVDIRREMRRSGGEIKATTLQSGLDALVKKFDASDGDRKQISKLDDKAIRQLAKKSGIAEKGFRAMRDHVRHRHLLLLGKPAGTPPSPKEVAKVASQILAWASTATHALESDMRALYFEAKGFASAYPDLMDRRLGMLHTPTLSQEAAFADAAKLLGAKEFDEDKLDDAAQMLASAIIGQLKKRGDGLAALFAADRGHYRHELSKALMDAVASQSSKADSGAARLEMPLGELFQRLDAFSGTVLSHALKASSLCFEGDALVEFSASGDRKTWDRDRERSPADGAAGISLYRKGKQTVLVKEIDVRPDPGSGAVPMDRQDASREALNHLLVNKSAPGLAPDVRLAPSTDGKVRLVMERPVYGNMGQFIHTQLQGDDRRPEAARAMCRPIAHALNRLHQVNMSHGTLHPEDVVLTPGDGDDVVVKLTNFGAAHHGAFMYAREDRVAASHGKSPERLAPTGTPQDAEASFSPQKDDVWAFGLMVYRMFSPDGRAAFPDVEADLKKAVKKYSDEYPVRPVGRGLPRNDSIPGEAREFIGWILNPDPVKRPSMADVLKHPFLEQHADDDALNLIHETGQLQDFIDSGPAQIREFAAKTGIAEVQVKAMIEYLRSGRDSEAPGDAQDAGSLAGFVNAFRAFVANRKQDTHAHVIFALHDRVEAFAAANPDLVANPPGNGAQAGSPAIAATPDSVTGVLGNLARLRFKANAKVSGVVTSKTVNGVKEPQFGVRIRNRDRNALQRITDRLAGAHIARREATERSVQHLLKRFEDQPGTEEILGRLRAVIRNPRRTLRAQELTDGLNRLVDKFNLDSVGNKALKAFVEKEGAGVLAFSKATGIPEDLIAAMQAHLRHRSALLDGSAAGKPPALERVADFAWAFERYMREAPTLLADPALSALEAEVRAFALSRPDLMGLRAGMVHTPGLTEKISFAKAAKLLGQPGGLDAQRAADAAKQLARLIVRSLQRPENAGRDLPMLFASTLGVEYCRELSNALKTAIAEQGAALTSGKAQSPLRPDKLATRLAGFSKAVYAEVLKNLPDHCDGGNVVEGNPATTWTRGATLSSDGATAEVFVYGNAEDTVVVKEMKSYEVRYQDGKNDREDDFKEARLHQHINATAPAAASRLHAVVQSEKGSVRFVMEHAVYGDLAGYMKTASGRADPARNEATLSLCKQVAENLYELHTLANVGHVDFKPANVLLTRGAGGAVLAQLTDFGASREGKFMHLREDPVESPYWKSPERLAPRKGPNGPRFSTHAADVWAFGVTVYQMYARNGSNPFDRPGFNQDVNQAILDYAQNYLATATAGSNLDFDAHEIPEPVRPFIRWILNPDPAARPTMAEILQHKFMTSTAPLSAAARMFIQNSVGADLEGEAGAVDATGARTRPTTPPDGVESDEAISSSDAAPPGRRPPAPVSADEESSALVESPESASDNQRGRSASGLTSDSSAEESTASGDESGPSGTFKAKVVPDRPDTDNEKAMKKSAETKQENVGMNTMLNPHLKVKRQRKGMTQGTFVKPSGSEESSS
jgi:aurora kinase